MSSWATSSLESAIMRSVWANVLTVETVSVRSFLRPRISKCPFFGSYLTFDRLRSGKRRRGFCFLRMVRRTSSAVFSIFFTVASAMLSSAADARRRHQGVQWDADRTVAELPRQGRVDRLDHLLRSDPALLADRVADRVSLDQSLRQVAGGGALAAQRHRLDLDVPEAA